MGKEKQEKNIKKKTKAYSYSHTGGNGYIGIVSYERIKHKLRQRNCCGW